MKSTSGNLLLKLYRTSVVSFRVLGRLHPKWLQDNKSKLEKEEYDRYFHQHQLIKDLNQTDPANFNKILDLVQKLQESGQPPRAIAKDLAPDFDISALAQITSQLSRELELYAYGCCQVLVWSVRDAAVAFEDVLTEHAYGGEINPIVTFATLSEKTTIISPEVLLRAGVPCCRFHIPYKQPDDPYFYSHKNVTAGTDLEAHWNLEKSSESTSQLTPNASHRLKLNSTSSTSLAITKAVPTSGGIQTFLDRAADDGLVIVHSPRFKNKQLGYFRRSTAIKGKRALPSCKEKQIVKEGQVICYVEQLGGDLPIELDYNALVSK
ncbi:hypothetical protein L2E82_45784 [Cichorium intybus]|uniref:Uncharacterized protein n=1 Tax=Cichorium intybus TaxID=13427 RepID=A0ACB8ZUW3_CICIN|nr:hypothetical protein L2E82_45784 [Cichorium intybus]